MAGWKWPWALTAIDFPRGSSPTDMNRLDQVLTMPAMRAAEQALIDEGSSVEALMERAGAAVAEWAWRLGAGAPVTVLAGPGNNGGDGYVAARMLAERGVEVRVIAPDAPRTTAAMAARAACPLPVAIVDSGSGGAVLVDALFGSGLTRAPSPALSALLGALRQSHRHVLAVDVPSGIDADSGAVLDPGLGASTLTLALGAWKHAHFAMPSAALMGALRLVDIGCQVMPGAARVLGRPQIAAPAADAHKYRRGLLAMVAGAMPGAARLAVLAARHGGAGYLKVIGHADDFRQHADWVIADQAALHEPRTRAVLVGPGLGRDGAAQGLLQSALGAGKATVIDADALILLRPHHLTGFPAILTPHEGELAALDRHFGLSRAGLAHKRDRALALARTTGAVVVAKGPDTVIAAPDGTLVLAPRASSWLSVAGTGDVLAGIIAARLAVLGDPLRAACEGVWLHGVAAHHAGAAFAAEDLAAALRPALAEALT